MAVITGAGRGIGRAASELLAEHGASVVVCELDADSAEETAALVRTKGARCLAPLMRGEAKREMAAGLRVQRKIVNVTSIAGMMGNPGQANYSAAKAGLIGLTKTVAREWGPFHINCNAVAFGLIATRLAQPKEWGLVVQGAPVGIPEQQLEAFKRSIPLQRVGSLREAASAILYLASPLSDYVNGDVLRVDGGLCT